MKYSIFRGCLIPFRFPEYERSAELIITKLELNYEYIGNFACCGSQIVESFDEDILTALSARNLIIAQNHDIDRLITLCGSCTYILKKTYNALQNEEIVNRINNILKTNNLKYNRDKKIKIMHIIELLNKKEIYDKLRKKIVRRLDLKVAIQNPCMIFRPTRINTDQNPDLIGSLLNLCGIELVDYAYANRCCGGTMLAFDESIGKKLAKKRYEELNKIKPDLIVTSCPNCHLVYNVYPNVIEFKIPPTVFLTQLVAYCLGFSFEEVALSRNIEKQEISKIIKNSV
ncbi:MAG: heterodisulfide reductase-related iron-sulfur binding cluster [Candidatus Helarchaeota archaeon]